jgi:hypothetical protein
MMDDGRVVTVEMVFKRRALAKRDVPARMDQQSHEDVVEGGDQVASTANRFVVPSSELSTPDPSSPDLAQSQHSSRRRGK